MPPLAATNACFGQTTEFDELEEFPQYLAFAAEDSAMLPRHFDRS